MVLLCGTRGAVGGSLRAPTARMTEQQQLVVVGLDGVLVDSEPATTRSAWLAAQCLWPEIMEAATEVSARQAGVRKAWVGGDFSRLTGVEESGMPTWLAAKLRQLRPSCRDGGYEAVLFARLCAEEALAASKGSRGARPLSVGEIELGWEDGLRGVLMARYQAEKAELVAAHEEAEERWWSEDPEGWHDANRWYGGAAEAVRRCGGNEQAGGGSKLVLLSRRPPRVSRRLLERAGAAGGVEVLAQEEWEGPTKAGALAALRRAHPDAPISFVDDSARTLLSCAADARLLPVALHFASYGYSSASQAARIGVVPRMRVLARSEDLSDVICSDK